ncbi:MAG: T9SS type A sorting domain-containing protein [Ignavibacteria bacterium]|nr:T9SS type A sorting domain-containing protein [Ignavibacteria bacterium]
MTHSKFILTAAGIIVATLGLSAQSSTSASGGEAKGIGGSASYTVGQTAVGVASNNQRSVTQGVQQPYTYSVIAGKNVKEIDVFIAAYPNPASTTLTLRIDGMDLTQVTYQLTDLVGKVLLEQDITGELTSIPMDEKANGAYILQVLKGTSVVKSFQIVKKQ